MKKPLGHKSYGSICHLLGSRLGPGDHHITAGQDRICTVAVRDNRDIVIVQEKLDGSNVGIARINDEIVPLTRAGYVANTSPYEQHHMFYDWCLDRKSMWLLLLKDGERLCGEWLALAHGTRYDLPHLPFVAFDLMRGHERASYDEFRTRLLDIGSIPSAPLIHIGGSISVADALDRLGTFGHYGALDPAEGLVYRVERDRAVDFLAKYVRPEKVDGRYFEQEIWNWKSEEGSDYGI